MNKNYLPAIFGIAAVIIYFVWGMIEGTYQHAWLIFLVACLADLIVLALISKQDENKLNLRKKRKEKKGD